MLYIIINDITLKNTVAILFFYILYFLNYLKYFFSNEGLPIPDNRI